MFLFDTHLKSLPRAAVGWPSAVQLQQYAHRIERKYSGMTAELGTSCFAFLDGCNMPVQSHSDLNIQQRYYNSWYGGTKVGNIFIWGPDGTILWARVNVPGTVADSLIASEAYRYIKHEVPDGYAILADSAFPALGGKIVKPLKAPQLLTATAEERARSRVIAGMRVPCEWGNRGLKSCFPRLCLPLPARDSAFRGALIQSCVHLYNFRTRTMDYSQIRTCFKRDYVRYKDLYDTTPSNLDQYLEMSRGRGGGDSRS